MSAPNKLLQAASGGAGDKVYVDDVFTTTAYNGSGSSQNIVNNIDLDGEGGMVWIKDREVAYWHQIADTERGANKMLSTNSSNAESSRTQHLTSFNSNGFTVGTDNDVNYSNSKIVSWTFRKQPGFFDIQTWTGNGSNRTISHNLGCVPGFIIVKRYSNTENWTCFHTSLGPTKAITLDATATAFTLTSIWNDTAPTATEFTVGTQGRVNTNGESYIAYIFAGTGDSASQIFGADGDEAIIKSGVFDYTSSGQDIDLGFEPQWIIYKNTTGTSTSYWGITDTMRPFRHKPNSVSTYLRGNANDAEGNNSIFQLLHNGFRNTGGFGGGDKIIYTAIAKRHKPADYGTDYFALTAYTGNDTSIRTFEFGPTQFDWHVNTRTDGNSDNKTHMRGFGRASSTSASQLGALKLNATSVDDSADLTLDHSGGCTTTTKGTINGSDQYYQAAWMRRPGLLDIVAYEGNYTARTISHQLDAVPEMMLVKSRTSTRPFLVYHSALGNDRYLLVNDTAAQSSSGETVWNTTTPTSSVFSVGAQNVSNENGKYFVALLYASSDGIQKIGSFTKSGNTDVDCGFSAAPRWIMVKRYDASGDWYVFYSFNTSGNDKYYLWNSNQPAVTNQNYIEGMLSGGAGGFRIEGIDDGDYIFMAIA